MNVLLVGGAGYIGSHVAKALKKAGFTPIVYDNLVTGHEWAVKWGPLVRGDIHDKALLSQVFEEYKPIGVIHLAAFIEARESILSPLKYFHNNVAGTIALLEAMQEANIHSLVFSSTAAVYGTPQQSPIHEHHPKSPINPYGMTKAMVEDIISATPNFSAVILRYFNAAGADPDGEIGEAHTPETHLIPSLLLTALGARPHFTLYGDGSIVRDFIHVSDLARAHVLALQYSLSQTGISTFNLGTGQGTSVGEIIDLIQEVTKQSIAVGRAPENPADPPILVANASRAHKALNWRPQHSMSDIIKTAWSWHYHY
jgi:UDP-arabinose 4-epimerase